MTDDVRYRSRPSAATADDERNIGGSGEARWQRSVEEYSMGRKYCSAWRSCCERGLTVDGGEPGSRLLLRRKRADRLKSSSRKMEEQFCGEEWMLGTNLEFCSRPETMRRSVGSLAREPVNDCCSATPPPQVKANRPAQRPKPPTPILATGINKKKTRKNARRCWRRLGPRQAPDSQQAMAQCAQ